MALMPDRAGLAFAAVILDMDGLMFDTEQLAREGWQQAASDFGYTLPDDVYIQIVGRTVPDAREILRSELGADFPFAEARACRVRYVEDYIAQHGIPLKAGLLTLLQHLDALGVRKAVASSTERASVLHKLALAGLLDAFDAIVCGDETENGKPAPDIFLAAARRLGVPPEECVVVEDSEPGIRAAHAAGMLAIMVPDLRPPSAEAAALAVAVLPSLTQVAGFLSTWNKIDYWPNIKRSLSSREVLHMDGHVYKIIEVTGSSQTSLEDAIQNAVARTAQTVRNLRWFEVVETRGYIEDGKVAYWQVTVKIGFNVEE